MNKNIKNSFLILCMLTFILMFFISCANNNKKMLKVSPNFFNPYYPEKATLIEPGDILSIRFYYNPELDEKIRVRSDGKISLLFCQGLKVTGLTPEDLQKEIVKIYGKIFKKPVVSVNLEKSSSNYVFISGEVLNGGTKQLSKNLTIGQLLMESRINIRTANLENLVLVRKTNPTKYKAYKIDARIDSGKERDVYLQPGDLIFVPRNTITKLGDFVQQYIRNIIPPSMNVGLGFTYELHKEKEYIKGE